MILLILGLMLIVSAISIRKSIPKPFVSNILILLGSVFMVIGVSSACFMQIDSGHVGVQTLFGKVDQTTLESGLNTKNPLTEVVEFDIKTQNYTMSSIHDEGDRSGDDAMRVLTADGLEVVIDLTILYRVIPAQAPRILKEIGTDYKNVVVRPITRTKIRDNAVYYDAVSLYSVRRDEFQQRIFKDIERDLKQRGFILEQLLVRNINLPESVKQAIESKINAEQEAQKMQFVLQKEKQEAERKRVEAQGIADYQKILSTGLSDKQLQYEIIKAQKEIATSPNAKVIILGGKGNTPIMIGDR